MERKITILSIDDEENIRFALGELFHFQGWEACSAPNVKKRPWSSFVYTNLTLY